MLRRLTDYITGEHYLQDRTGQQYRRTVCALAWPWHPLPGCVLVLGELRHRPTCIGTPRHVFLLAEQRSDDPAALLRTAERFQFQHGTPRIITPEDDDRILLIDVENDRRREERKPPLRTEPPLRWQGKGEGLLPYYLSLVQTRIVGDKTLHFSSTSSVPAEAGLASTAAAGSMTAAMIQWPAVCALCWALEALDMQPMPEWRGYGHGTPGGPADSLGGY